MSSFYSLNLMITILLLVLASPQPATSLKVPLFKNKNNLIVAEIPVGFQPTVTAYLTLDTLSPFTILDCSIPDGYDPNQSETSQLMYYNNSICIPPLHQSFSSDWCWFQFESAHGFYVFDLFASDMSDGRKALVPFGCINEYSPSSGKNNTTPVTGVLGLGQGHPSNFLTQSTLEKFAFTIPFHELPTASAVASANGFDPSLAFGPYATMPTNGTMCVQSTTILREQRAAAGAPIRDYYYLNLTGIIVGGYIVQGIDPKLFWPPSRGGSGFVLHTSSSQIVLPAPAYDAFRVVVVDLVRVLYGLDPVEPLAGYDLCFNTTDPVAMANVTPFFTPSMVLEFEGGVAHLKLLNGVPFQEVPDFGEWYYSCMLVVAGDERGGGKPSFVGLLDQIGYKFLYDLSTSGLSFTTG
ncbi:aspartyl protease family protein 2-like [Malus sylvestris]|uniref:aspartyl protease family protein 2-like n=1 Tax=Malus sylvestris TaxID=3752 RepID=UPI0021AC68FC|nr:aspartyl protease family protein 2-like [Malus sylvestris]